MLKECFLIAAVAVSLTIGHPHAPTFDSSSEFGFPDHSTHHDFSSHAYTHKVADRDMLLMQKKIFDLFAYLYGDAFHDTEYYQIGHQYDIKSNMNAYTNQEAVQEFLYYYKFGPLSKDAMFTVFNEEHRAEMILLYRLFYYAKDFTTFYKTACWARIYMNPALFCFAFSTALSFREDTKFLQTPAIYEIYPYGFFDAKLINDAQRVMMSRGSFEYSHEASSPKTPDFYSSYETYHLYSNFTDISYFDPSFDYEHKLSYFMNDVQLNAFYYYFRMMFPFWVNSSDFGTIPKYIRGEMYYFLHQQLMARYYLERFSNGYEDFGEFSWTEVNMPGFYFYSSFPNGIAFPRRDWWNVIPWYKLKYVEYVQQLENRFSAAIDSGYIFDDSGKKYNLYTPEGFSYLCNVIEGNYDSINLNYYGSFDVLARRILGMNSFTNDKNSYVPSSLEYYTMSMKDPAFYRLYNYVMKYFFRYKSLLPHYTKQELEFSGVKIESVDMDKFFTYFESKDYFINNAVDVPTMKYGHGFNIKAWQYNLNYKPFNYKLSISSDKNTKAILRIFLGPAFEDKYFDEYSYFVKFYKYFFMMDEFQINLHEGMNNIEHASGVSPFFKEEYLTGDKFYKKIMQAIEGKEPMTFSSGSWGFPKHLLLPKGSASGMKFKLFFFVQPFENVQSYNLPYFGQQFFYGKSLGYPLDRPMEPWFFQLSNAFFKDIYIYNQPGEGFYGDSSMINYGNNYYYSNKYSYEPFHSKQSFSSSGITEKFGDMSYSYKDHSYIMTSR